MAAGDFLVLILLVAANVALASVESNNSIENSTRVTGRSGRNDYAVYSPPDNLAAKSGNKFYTSEEASKDDEISPGFEPVIIQRLSKDDAIQVERTSPHSEPTYEKYVPISYHQSSGPQRPNPRYYSSGPMHKSGTSVNWNVWKGDAIEAAPAPASAHDNNKGGPPPDFSEYYLPADPWKGDPWTPDHMSMMMMMNQMQAANKPKLGGFLSKLTQDPAALLVAAILPFSIILAAVLPSLVNMMMNGGLPTITTTATGNTARSLDNAEFLKPVLQTIVTLGGRSFENPECMQRIFCQVTKGSSGNGTEGRSFQKSLYAASKLIDSQWLNAFGVKTLFDSMADGNCEKIPCSTQHSSASTTSHQKKSP